VKLCNPHDLSRCIELNLLVDTGSTYIWVRCEMLESLGIKPMTRWRFRTIDGRVIERNISEAIIEYMDEKQLEL